MPPRQSRALRPESFVKGAMIITLAGLVSRVMGALYKPIISRLFMPFDGQNGQAGLGLVSIVYPYYMIMISITATGINLAISKLVADRLARGRRDEAQRVFRISLTMMAVLGLTLAVGLYLLSDKMAAWHGRPETAPGFKAIAPAIFVVSVMAAYRGLFQGFQIMTPYAMSQIYEQLARILTGAYLVWFLVRSSETVPLGAAGYNFGAVTGGLVGLIYLLYVYWRQRGHLFYSGAGEPAALTAGQTVQPNLPGLAGVSPGDNSARSIVWQVVTLATPISIIAAVQNLVQVADSQLVIPRLESIGVLHRAADAALGMLSNAFAITVLPSVLTNSLYISLLPAITEALARGNVQQARARSHIALRLTMLFGIPATVGIYMLADDIYRIFYGSYDGGPVLRAMGLLVLTMMLQQTTSGILQGAGDVVTPSLNFLVGLVLKFVLNYWWTGMPAIGVLGAAWASVVAFSVALLLNLWFAWRRLGVTMDFMGMWIKPGVAAGGMALFIWAVLPRLAHLLGRPLLAALAAMPVAAAIYFALMLAIGGFTARDFEVLPRFGGKLVALLRRYHLLRDQGANNRGDLG